MSASVYKNKRKDTDMVDLGNNRLLSRKEAAEFLGVKVITLAIWKSTQRHNIPVVKVGRLVRYRFGDLLDFVERRTINEPTTEGKERLNTSSHTR
jgi:excisionase family DNA binding protein